MNDEIKTDTEKSLEHFDEVIKSDGLKAAGWIKTHAPWLWGLGGVLVGFILGYLRGRGHIV